MSLSVKQPSRRMSRRREISDLMRHAALGGAMAGLAAAIVCWPAILSQKWLHGMHPLGVAGLIVLAAAAVGLAFAGSAAYPLSRTYPPGSMHSRWLSFGAGMLSVPATALVVLLWKSMG